MLNMRSLVLYFSDTSLPDFSLYSKVEILGQIIGKATLEYNISVECVLNCKLSNFGVLSIMVEYVLVSVSATQHTLRFEVKEHFL